MKTIRCAIYTRKSSEEGLEQDFNSLDAQREACTAYVLSQASEGWKLLPQHYDDGGLSGGTLDRPALGQLLEDVKAGRIDIIVVYKVDRLTRSLFDFAKLVETFDAADVSFVSVTQSFNTTTSMGRLTLNMLLSFAQFEREVTAERIRDKIAASKAKGMWMGGNPPLGYRPDGRSLAIVEEHAALVCDIFKRYRETGNVRLVTEALEAQNITTPRRQSLKGKCSGGCRFSRGQLYSILKNPIYAGDIAHKGNVYPGNHEAIIPREDWDAVQQQLADNVKGERKSRETNRSLLAGLLCDSEGEPLIPVHTTKGNKRYRYYVRKSDQHGTRGDDRPSLRIPALEIEQAACKELALLLDDPLAVKERMGLRVAPQSYGAFAMSCAELQDKVAHAAKRSVRKMLKQIVVQPTHLEFSIDVTGTASLVNAEAKAETPAIALHRASIQLKRSGHSIKLVHENGTLAGRNEPNPTLVRLLLLARKWWSELSQGEIDIATLSRREGFTASYVTWVVRVAFLSPRIVEAILAGTARADLDGQAMLSPGAVPQDWDRQEARYMPLTR